MGTRNRERIQRIKTGAEYALSIKKGNEPNSYPVKFKPSLPPGKPNRVQRRRILRQMKEMKEENGNAS